MTLRSIRIAAIAGLVVGCAGGVAPSPGATQPSLAPASAQRSNAVPPSAWPTPASSTRLDLDGQIVFEDAGVDFQHTQIWLENADGSSVRKVVSDDGTDNAASLSPDGHKIVFYRGGAPKEFGDIMLVDVDGANLRELVTGSAAKGCDAGPEGDAWSPDGRRIAYERFCFDQAGTTFIEGGIWTIAIDGTDARRVTKNVASSHLEDHRASWSPDGRSLVFERIDTSVTPERAAIFTIGIDGTGLQQVTPWELDGNDPDWSPDGAEIAFNASAEPSPTQNIYTIRPDGTDLRQLTTYREKGQATFHPSWSPDASRILFSHSPSTGGWADFFVMNRDGSDQQIIAATDLHENHGTWGPSPAP
jgi:Tol biopolymer transport system component